VPPGIDDFCPLGFLEISGGSAEFPNSRRRNCGLLPLPLTLSESTALRAVRDLDWFRKQGAVFAKTGQAMATWHFLIQMYQMIRMKHLATRLARIRRNAQERVKTGVCVAFRAPSLLRAKSHDQCAGKTIWGWLCLASKSQKRSHVV
jgi:hypothetical protein